jgi:D-alanyl-D-alanine carboxypeptidase/D-alanyl-D-alanine-endopeptidase (penicillin-binding protein 4)
MTRLLVHVQKQFPIFAEMLTALPFAGIDGTLKRRMKGTVAEGWVRAKTGNLNGVISLSGYAGHRDGSVRAFTFIFNGKGGDGENARALFDALAVELVE